MAETNVTKADEGRVIVVNIGDAVSLELPGNPTTGYTWALDALDDVRLGVEASGYRLEGPGVGTGGYETWKLRARRPGRTSVALKRWRSWEGESSVIERFTVTFDIRG